jgi:acyl carrier protein
MDQSISEAVLEILTNYLETDRILALDTKVITEFDLDSLDLIVLEIKFEDHFEVDIDEDILSDDSTIQDLINFIEKRLNVK